MSNLIMTKRYVDGVTILDLSGDIQMGQGNTYLHRTLHSLIDEGITKVLVNLANISYIDSSGLGELVSGFTTMEKAGGELKLLHLTQRVSELMMITKLLTVFETFDDERTAVESFGPDEPRVITQKLVHPGIRKSSIL
jgi:anti-sigma B factor antagonist